MMDRLQPLIRHRFWILFAISLPLAVTGYFLANSEMQAATESRESQLESVLTGVPSGTSEPNKDYATKLAAINEELQKANNIEIQKLWEGQRERMTWPEVMLPYLPNEHRGEISQPGRKRYALEYSGILKRLWEKVQPVVSTPRPLGLKVDWPEKVLLQPETMPVQEITRYSDITTKQLWDAQEDVWLLELLFDAIVRTNEGASFIGDAPVRAISELYLTGGDGNALGFLRGESSAADGGRGGAWGGGKGKGRDESSPWGGGGGGGGGWGNEGTEYDEDAYASSAQATAFQGPIQAPDVKFEIAEEIGMQVPDPELAQEQAATSGGGSPFGSNFGPGGLQLSARGAADRRSRGGRFDDDDDDGGGTSRMQAGTPGAPGMFRYVGDPKEVEDKPYHERAFYMSAIVMLPELPNFLTELASSEWPVRIGRFQIGPHPYADMQSTSQQGYSGRSRGLNYDDEDNESGALFGRGLSVSSFGKSRSAGSRSLGSRGFGSRGFGGGGSVGVLPPTIAGPSEIDPNWFSSSDLVRVDFYGVITIYKPITDAAITKKSDGTTEEESLEEIKATEAAEQAAEEAATEEGETPVNSPDASPEGTPPGDELFPSDGDSEGDVSASEAGDEEASPSQGATDDEPFEFGAADEAEESPPDQ